MERFLLWTQFRFLLWSARQVFIHWRRNDLHYNYRRRLGLCKWYPLFLIGFNYCWPNKCKLIIDLGSNHPQLSASAFVSSDPGLTIGVPYTLDFFYCNRRTNVSCIEFHSFYSFAYDTLFSPFDWDKHPNLLYLYWLVRSMWGKRPELLHLPSVGPILWRQWFVHYRVMRCIGMIYSDDHYSK